MEQHATEPANIMSPETYQAYMNNILTRCSSEQLAILTAATEKALKLQKESELKISGKSESATWRQIDLLERIRSKSPIYRVERRILTHYLRTYFIDPLNALKPDLGNNPANIQKLEAQIQIYQDIVNLLNQKYTSTAGADLQSVPQIFRTCPSTDE